MNFQVASWGDMSCSAVKNNIDYVPVALFDANGEESIKQTLDIALSSVRVRSDASSPVNVTMNVSGVVGVNQFTPVASIPIGGSGEQPVIDLNVVFPPTGVEQGIAFLCNGTFTGLLVVEGSLDGVNFNPIGDGFQGSVQSPSLLGSNAPLEFSPLTTRDLVRYIKVVLNGVASTAVAITMGGTNSAGGSAGAPMDVYVTTGGGVTAQALGTAFSPPRPSASVVLGTEVTIDTFSPGVSFAAVVIGPFTTLHNSFGAVLIGLAGDIEDSPDAIAIGNSVFVHSGCNNAIVIGVGSTTGTNCNNAVLVGPNSDIGASSQDASIFGSSNQIGDNNNANTMCGTFLTMGQNCNDDGIFGVFNSIGDGVGVSYAVGLGLRIEANVNNGLIFGVGGHIGHDSTNCNVFGSGANIYENCHVCDIVGTGSIISPNCDNVSVFGSGHSIGSSVLVSTIMGEGCQIADLLTNIIAVGFGVQVQANRTVAVGYSAGVAADNAIAIGTYAQANATTGDNIAIGSFSTSSGAAAIAFGSNTSVGGGGSVAIGLGSTVGLSDQCVAIGQGTTIYDGHSFCFAFESSLINDGAAVSTVTSFSSVIQGTLSAPAEFIFTFGSNLYRCSHVTAIDCGPNFNVGTPYGDTSLVFAFQSTIGRDHANCQRIIAMQSNIQDDTSDVVALLNSHLQRECTNIFASAGVIGVQCNNIVAFMGGVDSLSVDTFVFNSEILGGSFGNPSHNNIAFNCNMGVLSNNSVQSCIGFNGVIGQGVEAVIVLNGSVGDDVLDVSLFNSYAAGSSSSLFGAESQFESGCGTIFAFGAHIYGAAGNITTFNASITPPSFNGFVVGNREDSPIVVQGGVSILCTYGGVGEILNTIGVLSFVDDGSVGSVGLLGNLAANTTNSVAILGTVNSRAISSIAIGWHSWAGRDDFGENGGADIAIGPYASVFQSYNSIAIGNSARVSIQNSRHRSDNAIAFGYQAVIDDFCPGSIAIGYGAHATAAGEVVIGNNVSPITKFHVATTGHDLVDFDTAAMAAALDSSMYLLYKNGAGTVVLNKVLVEAVTGYLHVPA